MSREKVKEIVDYMVSEGTQNTNYGCWAFDIPELCDKFGLPLEWFYEHNDDICRELDERDEVADYEQNYDWNNHPPLLRKKSSGRCSESTGKSSLLIPSEGRAKMRKRRRSRFWPTRITARKVTFM